MSTPAVGNRRRRLGTAGDMVRSLGLVIAVIAVLLVITPSRQLLFPTGHNGQSVKVVSYTDELQAAELYSHGRVLAPHGLPAGWRATSATVTPQPTSAAVDLHIGFVTPRNRYAALEESTRPVSSFLDDVVGKGRQPAGSRQVGGASWQLLRADDGDLAMLRQVSDGVAVVVIGNAPAAEMDALAGSLSR